MWTPATWKTRISQDILVVCLSNYFELCWGYQTNINELMYMNQNEPVKWTHTYLDQGAMSELNLPSPLTFTAHHQTPCCIPPFISKITSIHLWPDLLYWDRKNRESEESGGSLELNTISFSCQIHQSLLCFKEPLQEFISHICQKWICDTSANQSQTVV